MMIPHESPSKRSASALGPDFFRLNLYATVATLGLLQRFGVLHLPPGLRVLSHPWVLGVAIALYLIEFFADRFRTSTQSGMRSTLSFVRPPRPSRFLPPLEEPHRNGAGAPRCSQAESPLASHGTKPARAPP